mgnify:CR=1 FL=1
MHAHMHMCMCMCMCVWGVESSAGWRGSAACVSVQVHMAQEVWDVGQHKAVLHICGNFRHVTLNITARAVPFLLSITNIYILAHTLGYPFYFLC